MSALTSKTERRHPSLRLLLLGGAEEQRGEVKAVLSAVEDPALEIIEGSQSGGAPTNGDRPPDVTMMIFTDEEETSSAELKRAAEASPRPAIFALLKERSPSLMRRVLRAGADEVLFMPLEPSDLTRALLKISEARRRLERSAAAGKVCSLFSTVGGVGVTTLAAGLALALDYKHQKRVALVDLDLQTGGLAVFLNLEPERTILPLTQVDKKLDSIQLESALTRHDSGIYLLAAPKRIDESEAVSDVTVAAVLDLLRELFDFVIVDCGGYVNEIVATAWERSDNLFYVLNQSIAAARCAVRFLDLFKRLGLGELQPSFVLNRFVSNHPISEALINHTLAQTVAVKIPRDDKATERAQLTGQDLWQIAPGSLLTQSIEALSLTLTSNPDEAAASPSRKFVSRLLVAVGARS